ncbi:MAG: polysaccharide deacetylase family protein [Chitinophagaceae bacterium]|nr:polysaccharide deacetylase family protein [Chitinophagaceae bacterium]
MRYIVTTPWWLRLGFPNGLTWDIKTKEKILYLTFDDGPHPEITPFVLDTLKNYNAKATFFCIGKNVKQHPEIYKRILLEGHRTGNHTHNHFNAWKTSEEDWLNDVKEAAQWIDSDLFRPPYGKIKSFAAKLMLSSNPAYRIIMWNVLSADFDTEKTADQCFYHVQKHAGNGSIIVFHDSEKAWPRLKEALPKTLEHFAGKGFEFKGIA